MRFRFRVFASLTGLLVVAVISWQLLRHEMQGPEREAWSAVTDTLRVQQARIDSLLGILASLDGRVDRHKQGLAAWQERLLRFERLAVDGRLPAPQHGEYMRAIAAHNAEVEAHNSALVEMHAVYARYSALIDTHNALIDSANALQRRATETGYALPDARLRLRSDPRDDGATDR